MELKTKRNLIGGNREMINDILAPVKLELQLNWESLTTIKPDDNLAIHRAR